tara:strand:- start:6460 stop:6699 length:240 start_codon:yes stop_codon:yes gene_type:complete
MKSYDDIRHYKRMYYLANKDRLCNYSTNYYKYKKCNGEFSNEEIDSQLRLFIKKYKKHSEIRENKIKIRKDEPIIVSFS